MLIADDHPLFLFAIAHSVNARPELELVGQATTGREALASALETRPDLAVLDVDMPDLGGLDVLHAFTREGLATRVLFVSGSLDAETAYQLIEAGAAGRAGQDRFARRDRRRAASGSRGRDGARPRGPGRADAGRPRPARAAADGALTA